MIDWPVYVCLFVRRIDVRGEAHSSLPYRLGTRTLARAHANDDESIYTFQRSRVIDRPAAPRFELTAVAPRRSQLQLELEAAPCHG